MTRLVPTAAAAVFSLAGLVFAQTSPPAPPNGSTVTITGCVAPVQRDGSLSVKAGATATPDTAPMEANSLEPTGQYLLLQATRPGADKASGATSAVATSGAATPTTPAQPTSYALSGHESELAKFNASRVEIVGTIVPTVGSGIGGHNTEAVDGIQRVRVTSIKKVEGSCSAEKK